jgi:hypothetical protein
MAPPQIFMPREPAKACNPGTGIFGGFGPKLDFPGTGISPAHDQQLNRSNMDAVSRVNVAWRRYLQVKIKWSCQTT